MKDNLRLFIVCLVISVFMFAPLANAATEATVTATVTVQNVAITRSSDGTVPYGTLTTSDTQDTTTVDLGDGINDTQTFQNTGNVTSDLAVLGQDSGAWELADAAGSETYAHKFCVTSCDELSPTWTAFNEDTYTDFALSVAGSGTQDVDLQISTPTSTATFTQQSVDVTVQISAS